MSSTDEEQLVVCDSCGLVNGCEHYYIQDQKMDNLTSESFSIELENSENNIQTERTDEIISEMLISFVSLRPALWNHKLPLIERTRTIKEHLWVEVVSEYGGKSIIQLAWFLML
ncbi:hypothetical protein FQA39_LY13116 [Lamprigera yunnana]|nr:hypothetical protein FQA39_LY05929 [Lamprigera yunnana]KAF5278441.1 hypothetical protein FQA39_LY05930 [Lamprigera yunnana]KAF5279471.1 hypothetical protein FQA39_LY05581 [Lamprigera yunnana]KAF5295455.1 hypothetical protein FQA39_LY13116 [Lamprigera yunnana]